MKKYTVGKAYTNRKPIEERPESDFYRAPSSLTQVLWGTCEFADFDDIYEPMAGDGAIASVLRNNGYNVIMDDIRTTGKDFLDFNSTVDYIVTNPAFSIFTETVQKCDEVCLYGYTLLGKMNFFAAHSRTELNLWRHLKHVYIFDRQVDYRTPYREDGAFCVGNLVTGWFVFDKSWDKGFWNTSVMDVQKWATLGSYERYVKNVNKKKSIQL